MQDLVAVGVADAGDQGLVAQGALDLAALVLEEGGEAGLVEVVRQRVRAQAGDARDLLGVLDHVDRQALLGARLGQVEALAGLQGDPQGQRALSGSGRAVGEAVLPVEPSGAGEMGDQVGAARRLKVQELAVPAHRGDLTALDRGEGWVVRLEDADRHRQHPDDLMADQMLGEEVLQRFDLGEFRHGSRVPLG